MRVIVSRAGYGKTERMLAYTEQRRIEGKTSYIMVPEQFTLQTELLLMQRVKTKTLTDVKVMSFERLAQEVLKKYGGYKRKTIDEVGKHMALRRVFEESGDEIRMYRSAFRKEGFVSELSHTIAELKKMAISGERLLLESAEATDQTQKRKFYEVGMLYHRFEDYMRGHYIDNEDRVGLLSEMIDQAVHLKEIEFFFDSFNGFTEQELEVIDKLCKMEVALTFALTYDSDDNTGVFEKTAVTVRRLQSIDSKYGKQTRIENVEKNFSSNEELSFLERHLFDYRQHLKWSKEEVESISIYEALSVEDEIEHTVFEILRLIRDRSYRYQDILVVTSMPEVYTSKLRRAFVKYDIPHFIDIKRDLLGSSLMETIFSFLDMMIYNLSYDAVFSFLKSGFADLEEQSCYVFENFCLKWGIKGNKWHQEKFFTEEKYFSDAQERQAVSEGWHYVRSLYGKYASGFEEKQTGRRYSEKLFAVLSDLRIKQKNDRLVELLRREGEVDYANEIVQIWNVLLTTMDQLVDIMGEQRMDLKEYKLILQEGIHGQKIGVIPPTADQVITATMDRSRSAAVKALFFLGVNEGQVPRAAKESPVFQEEDKERLKERGIDLPSESRNRTIEEEFNLYTLMSKPTEYLGLSYSLSDAEGKTLRHAPVIDRVRFLFPGVKVRGSFDARRVEEDILSVRWTLQRLNEQIRAYMDDEETDEKWLKVYDWFRKSKDAKCREELQRLEEGLMYRNEASSLDRKTALLLYDPIRLSATRVERFEACPFAHFLDYGIRPQERKVYEIDALELGTTFHQAMEKWAALIEDESKQMMSADRERCDEEVDKIIEASLTDGIRILMENSSRNAYMLTKMKKVAQRAAWTMLQHKMKGRFERYGEEISISDQKVSLSDGKQLSISAKVDRADILREGSTTYVKVIDYKSGEKIFDLSDVYDGINLQLMLYLDLMLGEVEKKYPGKAEPAGAFYFYLADRRINTDSDDAVYIEAEIEKKLRMEGAILKDRNILAAMDREIAEKRSSSVVNVRTEGGEPVGDHALTREEFKMVMDHIRKKVTDAAESICEGKIDVSPYRKQEKSPCEYCRYLSICKFDEKLGNEYRRLRKNSAQEVLERLKREDSKKGGEI